MIANTKILPGRVARDLEVRHNGDVLMEPSLTILRLVNTGDRPIKAEDFESDIVIRFEGVRDLSSATWTASRPADLRPDIEIDDDCVRLKPTLINPEDMLELQVLSAGQPRDISVAGRVADLSVIPRKGLPYPPGSGREGEMVGMDRFVWYVFTPAFIVAIGAGVALGGKTSPAARVLVLVTTGILGGVLYPLFVRYLVRRRRLWRS